MPPVSVELKKQVKAANDITDVIGAYIPVSPAGKLFKADEDPFADTAGDWEDTEDDSGGEDPEGFDDPEADEDDDEDF